MTDAPPPHPDADAPPAHPDAGGPPPDGQTTTATAGEFGSSEYGARMDYAKSEYKDLWAMICFWVHVVLIFVLMIYFWAAAIPAQVDEICDLNGGCDASVTVDSDTEAAEDDADLTGVIVVLLCAVAAGTIFGLIWLQCMKLFAEQIIKIMLFVSIGCWVVVAIVGLIINIALTVIGVLLALIMCLYAYCIWSRIPFSAVMLSLASQIVQTYGGVVWCALLTILLAFIWQCFSIMAIVGYYTTAILQYVIDCWDDDLNCYTDTDGNYVCESTCSNSGPSGLVVFLLLISYYWGIQTFRNVSHTTTCGVAATWYFNPGVLDAPVSKAFKRTMTTSFGSVAFGSLLVAILQATKAMLKSSRRGPLACIAICLLACVERLIRYFNKYAFCQVAIYGTSFWEAAKATWDLFLAKGIQALINDDLSGMALFCGAALGFVTSGITSYLVASAFYPGEANIGYQILLALLGAVLGYIVVVIILLVVASGVVAIFVCYSEDPAALQTNRPEAFARLSEANEQIRNMAFGVQQPAPVVQQGQQQGV